MTYDVFSGTLNLTQSILCLCHRYITVLEAFCFHAVHAYVCVLASVICSLLVSGARRHDHITLVLTKLHWLPVHKKVMFKTVVLV